MTDADGAIPFYEEGSQNAAQVVRASGWQLYAIGAVLGGSPPGFDDRLLGEYSVPCALALLVLERLTD